MVHTISICQTTVLAGVVTTTAVVLGTYYYYLKLVKNQRIPTKWTSVGKVKKLYMYPLKSGKRNDLTEVECTKKGFMEKDKLDGVLRLKDRSFQVYKPENLEYRTGRQFPRMVLISVKSCSKDSVVFEAPDMLSLVVQIPSREFDNVIKIRQFRGEIIHSRDCGDEAAAWISKYLQDKDSGLRLAYYDDTFDRYQINTLYKDLIDFEKKNLRNESAGLFTDLTALMLINEASVKEMTDKGGIPDICTNNYRPNILISDPTLLPFAEDKWKWIKIGDVVMKNVADCIRCMMTTINSETGVRRTDNEPLKVLSKHHGTGMGNGPVMGIHLEVFQTGKLSVGDTVYVSE